MKIQIVDRQDNLIGAKERTEVNRDKDIFRTAALWLRNGRGEVLLAKRSLSKDKDPGMWGPAVAGTVDEGETYDTTIYREAEEEIGLHGVQFELGPKVFYDYARPQWVQWYFAVVDRPIEKFTKQDDEVDELMWTDEKSLLGDVENNQAKYVPSMPRTVQELCL